MIIDSQVHIWAPDRPDRQWRGGAKPHLPEPLGYETLRSWMDEAGVDAAILVPPPWEGDRNDFALEAAQKYPARFAVMGRIALENPASVELLDGWTAQPGMRGIRLNVLQEAAKRLIADGAANWFWPAAERHNIPLMVLAPSLLSTFGKIAERHPGLRIIIDHMGCDRDDIDDAVARKVDEVVALARHPNVYVKVSAAPCLSTAPFPFRNIHPYIRRAIDAFGPQRSIWGTDLTRFIQKCSYRDSVTMFTEHMDFLSESDKQWVMGRTIATCLGWPAPSST
jgi:predicted TIM-barrel fold metal-dependent hydrolase